MYKKPSKKVSDLPHFPFNNFISFQKAYENNEVYITLDPYIYLRWAFEGADSPTKLKLLSILLNALTYIAIIIFIIYLIVSYQLLLLIALPIFLLFFLVLQPEPVMAPLRKILVVLIFFVLGVGFYTEQSWLISICITLLIMWFSKVTFYKIALTEFAKVVLLDEALMCDLWNHRLMSVQAVNGNCYWSDWCRINGRIINYN